MEFMKKNWHLLLFPILPFIMMMGMLGNFAWERYQDSFAHHTVGTCIKAIDFPGHEFRQKTYEYKVIIEVGKERYRYMRVYRFGTGEWTAYEWSDEFRYVDRFGEPEVVNCSEVRIMMGK